MSKNFQSIKKRFDSGELSRKDVLNMVIAESITFDEYRMITDKNYKEPQPKEEVPNPKLYWPVDHVETTRGKGPRGDYYDWCNLLENNTLEFGSEEGNYAGGTTLSYCFYGDRDKSYPYNHPVTEEYWESVRKRMKYEKEYQHDFYLKIIQMCERNNATDVLDKISEVLEEKE